jgi:hypothetical protein
MRCRYPYGGDMDGKAHYFLWPSAPSRLQLLRPAFSSDARRRHRFGARGTADRVALVAVA